MNQNPQGVVSCARKTYRKLESIYSTDFGSSSPSKGRISYKETSAEIMVKPILSARCFPGQILLQRS